MRQQSVKKLRAIRSNDSPLFFMLGPCAIENERHTLAVAKELKCLSEDLGFTLIFKSSFDKANRTSVSGYRSVGLDAGLAILRKVRDEFDLPIVTDVHEVWQVALAAQVCDVIQIPAFLCRQTDLLVAAGKSGRIVNVKKGQFVTASAMQHAAEKIALSGNDHVWLCERGSSFGLSDLVVDQRNFFLMKKYNYPVVYDATHSVQKPSGLGSSSGGDRRFVADLAIAAVSQGIAGIFMEVHEEPERALCDGPNSIRLSQLKEVLSYLIELDTWVKSRERPHVS